MLCLVSFISLMIHSYSARYLLFDPNQSRFIGQLSLLTFSALLLVLSGSLFTSFVAWQLIGLSLYLLLNHYHYDIKANQSAKKKFMINRVGDICFLIAVIIALQQYHTTQFSILFAEKNAIDSVILLLIFVAVMTKSAQFPFHIWLIDTMEAPTPVSAFMHAGIINAGGFLLVRLSPLYVQASGLMVFIFLVGLTTALLGKFFMKNQPDIKKQLAYSTMGQMGYMVMQCGLGCFASALFHLISHGCFKAMLFLSSGSTIKESNQRAFIERKYKRHDLKNTSLSFLLTSILIAVGYAIYKYPLHGGDINFLLFFFIGINLFQLVSFTLEISKSKIGQLMAIVFVIGIYIGYLLILRGFGFIVNTVSINKQMVITSSIIGFIIVLSVILAPVVKKCLPAHYRWKFLASIYLFSFYKGGVEKCYRHYLINPIRSLGDDLLSGYNRLPLIVRKAGLYLFISLLLTSLLSLLLIIHKHLYGPHISLILLSIMVFWAVSLVANRAMNLAQLLMTITLLVLILANIPLMIGKPNIVPIGVFQLINSSLLIISFLLFAKKQTLKTQPEGLTKNRLPWSHFYMSTFLMLLIGIPGTASFISEFTLLYGLAHINLLLAGMLGVAMLLLALIVLHALQSYFFNPKSIGNFAVAASPALHTISLFSIGFNIFNGLFPIYFLSFLSKTIGGI